MINLDIILDCLRVNVPYFSKYIHSCTYTGTYYFITCNNRSLQLELGHTEQFDHTSDRGNLFSESFSELSDSVQTSDSDVASLETDGDFSSEEEDGGIVPLPSDEDDEVVPLPSDDSSIVEEDDEQDKSKYIVILSKCTTNLSLKDLYRQVYDVLLYI